MNQTLNPLGYLHSGSLSWKSENSPNSNHQSEKEHIFLRIQIMNDYDLTKKCSSSQMEYNRQQFLIEDGASVSVFSGIPVKSNPSNLASVSYPVVGGKPGGSYWLITLIVCTCECVCVCLRGGVESSMTSIQLHNKPARNRCQKAPSVLFLLLEEMPVTTFWQFYLNWRFKWSSKGLET